MKNHPSALKRGFEKYGPTIKINSKFGLRFIDRFSRYRRFWRFFGILSQIISLLLMVMMIFIMVVAVINLPASFAAGGIGVEYALAIPGLNPLLPFWYGLLALIIAMVCHEMAHGLQAKSNDIGVKHTGLLYAVVPLGAFVEPDQEDVEKAPRRAKIDLYTAGISTNFIIAIIAFSLFSPVMLGGIDSPYMDNCAVYQEAVDSPAELAGMPTGAIIMSVNGSDFTYTADYYTVPNHFGFTPGDDVTITYATSDVEDHLDMRLGTYVMKVVPDSPGAQAGLEGKWIVSMEYNSTTYWFYTAQGFSNFMSITEADTDIVVNTVAADGTTQSVSIPMGNNNGIGYLGVYTNTSGMGLITPRIMLQTAGNPLYGATDVRGVATGLLS
ncbi:MAG: site-2 protease family protein, partial [archaeon]|nr:site-2 protease family protein [archaeon]